MACERKNPSWRRAIALIVLGCACAAPAAATLYVCTDADGKTITSDILPRECAQLPIKELRPDGSVRRVIEPPLTAEQRAARAEQARRAAERRERQRSQTRRDIALMETYSTEAEIEAARAAALASRQAMIEGAASKLEGYARERERLENEAEFYANRKAPAKLARAFEINEELVQSEQKRSADTRVEMARINERFDAELKRFRELVTAGARPPLRTGHATSN